jgi:hypothetical protein
MNTSSVYTSVFAIFCIFIITIHANSDTTSLEPNTTISIGTHELKTESTNEISLLTNSTEPFTHGRNTDMSSGAYSTTTLPTLPKGKF